MALTSGYLVMYIRHGVRFSTMYDEYLNVIEEIDPDSEELLYRIKDAEATSGLGDDMWDDLLGDLSLQERTDAIVYRLENEVLTNAEIRIEEVMETNDDEQSVGYNGE